MRRQGWFPTSSTNSSASLTSSSEIGRQDLPSGLGGGTARFPRWTYSGISSPPWV